jgi:hypothetical protein
MRHQPDQNKQDKRHAPSPQQPGQQQTRQQSGRGQQVGKQAAERKSGKTTPSSDRDIQDRHSSR